MTGWPWPLDGAQAWFEGLWDWVSEAASSAVSVVSDWILGAQRWLGDRIADLGSWLDVNVVKPLVNGFAALVSKLAEVSSALAKVADGIVVHLEGAGAWLVDRVMDGLIWLKDVIFGWVDGSLRWATDTFRWLRDEMADSLGWVVDQVRVSLGDLLQGGLTWVQDALRGVGEALGSSLQGFLEWLVGGLEWLASSIAGAVDAVRKAVEPTFASMGRGILEALTAAVKPGSPDPEMEESVRAFVEEYVKRILELATPEAGSLPEFLDLQARAAGVMAVSLLAQVGANIAGIAVDLAHPVKQIGSRAFGQALVEAVNVPGLIGPVLMAPLQAGVFRPLTYRYNEASPFAVPGPSELVAMASRRHLDPDELIQAMKLHALDESWSSKILEGAYVVPGFADLRSMVWRDLASEEGLRDALRAQGVREDYVEAYAGLIPMVPGPGDLITMAVREVFTRPELQAEFPEEFGALMARQGYHDLWARYFWAAHWVLVPVGQLYEMYHRGLISRESMAEQLKYHDFTAEWREKLMAISWRLPGAIEARWMFRWGVLDVEGLRDLLIAGGLDPDWAPRVAEAVAKNQWLTEMNRLRDNAKGDYVRGFITEAQLRADLEGLGYPSSWVEFHVRDALEDGERRFKDDVVDTLGDGYLKDLLTDEELEARLADVLVRPQALERELERLYVHKYKKPKPVAVEKILVATVSTLLRAFREAVIDEARLREELEARGYEAEDIELMIALEEAKMG